MKLYQSWRFSRISSCFFLVFFVFFCRLRIGSSQKTQLVYRTSINNTLKCPNANAGNHNALFDEPMDAGNCLIYWELFKQRTHAAHQLPFRAVVL